MSDLVPKVLILEQLLGLGLPTETAHTIFDAFLAAANDYCADNRGDVGSWVREASLLAMQRTVFEMRDYDATKSQGIL